MSLVAGRTRITPLTDHHHALTPAALLPLPLSPLSHRGRGAQAKAAPKAADPETSASSADSRRLSPSSATNATSTPPIDARTTTPNNSVNSVDRPRPSREEGGH